MPSFTTYHPYTQSPSALTEYLKQKLQLQRAKHLSRSRPAQVKWNIPLECNSSDRMSGRAVERTNGFEKEVNY